MTNRRLVAVVAAASIFLKVTASLSAQDAPAKSLNVSVNGRSFHSWSSGLESRKPGQPWPLPSVHSTGACKTVAIRRESHGIGSPSTSAMSRLAAVIFLRPGDGHARLALPVASAASRADDHICGIVNSQPA
jgi:hypothetical protein